VLRELGGADGRLACVAVVAGRAASRGVSPLPSRWWPRPLARDVASVPSSDRVMLRLRLWPDQRGRRPRGRWLL